MLFVLNHMAIDRVVRQDIVLFDKTCCETLEPEVIIIWENTITHLLSDKMIYIVGVTLV